MFQSRVILIVALALLAVGGWLTARFFGVGQPLAPGETRLTAPSEALEPIGEAAPSAARPYVVEEVAHGLEVPWSVVFTSRERLLVTERPGRLRVIENGVLRPAPLHVFSDVSSRAEGGSWVWRFTPTMSKTG